MGTAGEPTARLGDAPLLPADEALDVQSELPLGAPNVLEGPVNSYLAPEVIDGKKLNYYM
jgi:hypothetical protein